jgi:hypothetical protein
VSCAWPPVLPACAEHFDASWLTGPPALSVLIQSLQDDPTFPNPTSIVCFGLGSLVQSRIAQLQLLLMLDLAARFKVRVSL